MNTLCKSGFPKSFRSSSEFLSTLLEKNADVEYIPLHTNSEQGTTTLHGLMWDMEKQGYLQVLYKDIERNDTLFTVKLTINGINFVNQNVEAKRRVQFDNTTTKLGYATIIISTLSLIISIIALLT